jgi:hypothetical protein
MNTLRGCGLAAVALLIAATARSANVQDQNSAGAEFGLGLGQSVLEAKIPGVTSGSESATGFNILGGYRFDRYLAVEAGYLHGGAFTVPGGSVHLTSAQLSAVGTLPIGDYFALYARGGADHWWATDSGSTTHLRSATRFLYGGGVETFFDGALVRLEYQQSTFHDVSGDDPSWHIRQQYISASVVWLF